MQVHAQYPTANVQTVHSTASQLGRSKTNPSVHIDKSQPPGRAGQSQACGAEASQRRQASRAAGQPGLRQGKRAGGEASGRADGQASRPNNEKRTIDALTANYCVSILTATTETVEVQPPGGTEGRGPLRFLQKRERRKLGEESSLKN